MKLITETHFTRVQFNAVTKQAQTMAGGAYSLIWVRYAATKNLLGRPTDRRTGAADASVVNRAAIRRNPIPSTQPFTLTWATPPVSWD